MPKKDKSPLIRDSIPDRRKLRLPTNRQLLTIASIGIAIAGTVVGLSSRQYEVIPMTLLPLITAIQRRDG